MDSLIAVMKDLCVKEILEPPPLESFRFRASIDDAYKDQSSPVDFCSSTNWFDRYLEELEAFKLAAKVRSEGREREERKKKNKKKTK